MLLVSENIMKPENHKLVLNVAMIALILATVSASIPVGMNVLAQNSTSGTQTVQTIDDSFNNIVILAISITSLVATFISRSKLSADNKEKYLSAISEAKNILDMLKQDRETRKEAMETVYSLIPEDIQNQYFEQNQKPLIRLQKLNTDIAAAQAKLDKLNTLVNQFGGEKS